MGRECISFQARRCVPVSLREGLVTEIATILYQEWDIRDGRVVPETDDVVLAGGGVRLDATILYADLSESSKLATEFQQRTAAKVIRIFLSCMCRLIASHGGTITSFDGDRVMGIFIGDFKNTTATVCALQMNWVVQGLIRPMVRNYFISLKQAGFEVTHCVGIDTSTVLAVRAGQRGSNDLVWVGRAPNLAAKLSGIREDDYHSYVSDETFLRLYESAKLGGNPPRLMWEPRLYTFAGESTRVHRSSWWWSL